jgi:hypothetical protein
VVFFVYILFIKYLFVALVKTNTMNYKMISLYDRLKPHYKDVLKIKNISEPDLVSMIVEALEQESYVADLKYSSVLNLQFIFGNVNPFVYFKDI